MAKNKQKKASQKDLSKMRKVKLNKIREWVKAYQGDLEQLVRDLSATFNAKGNQGPSDGWSRASSGSGGGFSD
jgi:hypothetical protein